MSTNAPPTGEQSYVIPQGPSIGGIFGRASWPTLSLDAGEYVNDLKWPFSISVYDRMRSDPQIESLYRGMVLPIRRFRWYLDPDGARARAVNRLSEDMGIPIRGKKRQPRRRRPSFKHDDHLRHALLALPYGHMFFEQVGDVVVEEGRPFWRMHKLAPIMPKTIMEMRVGRDGTLEWVKQWGEDMNPPEISIDRLVCFVHDREGGNWLGRSLFRSAYQPWLLKDRLLRVDAIRHERNGMGVPFVYLPERATREQRDEAAKLSQQYRAGVASGGALPAGMDVKLKGVEGSVSDVLASIRYHDEAMARLMLQMFTQLGGGGEYGSKALGDTFVKFFAQAQEAVADWYAEIMNEYFVADWVEWNFGPDEKPPLLTYERDEDPELSAHELAQLVAQNVIVVDEDLEGFLRDKYGLPPLSRPRAEIQKEAAELVQFTKTDPTDGAAPPDEGEPNENVNQPPTSRTAD